MPKTSKPAPPPKDETVIWAEETIADPANTNNPLLESFQTLSEKYSRLVKRMDKITRISDNYQMRLREVNALLDEYARTDSLTGISNRRDLTNRITQEISRANRFKRTFSLLMLDLDRFKRINDDYGHLAGDHLLKEISGKMKSLLRTIDTCGRWGGEEFLILLPETPPSGAFLVAENMRSAIQSLRVTFNDQVLQVTVSIGVHQYHEGETIDECLRLGDEALYKAKRHGGNRIAH